MVSVYVIVVQHNNEVELLWKCQDLIIKLFQIRGFNNAVFKDSFKHWILKFKKSYSTDVDVSVLPQRV
jgi:hypothetical protein